MRRAVKAGCARPTSTNARGFLDSMPSELAATALADFRELDAAGKLAEVETAPATSEACCGSGSGTTSGARASRGTRAHSAAAAAAAAAAAVAAASAAAGVEAAATAAAARAGG